MRTFTQYNTNSYLYFYIKQNNMKNLIDHILALANDAYFNGHPEWQAIVTEAKEAEKDLEDEQFTFAGFQIYDVIEQANKNRDDDEDEDEQEDAISKDEAKEVMRRVAKNADASQGVNWDFIDTYINEVIKERATA